MLHVHKLTRYMLYNSILALQKLPPVAPLTLSGPSGHMGETNAIASTMYMHVVMQYSSHTIEQFSDIYMYRHTTYIIIYTSGTLSIKQWTFCMKDLKYTINVTSGVKTTARTLA